MSAEFYMTCFGCLFFERLTVANKIIDRKNLEYFIKST